MSAAVKRVRPSAGQGAALQAGTPRRASRALLTGAAVLGVLVVVAGALWSWNWASRSPIPDAGSLVVDSGVARIERVLSAARPQHAMPGMGSDDDPVADGERRVSVELTLQATGQEPLRFSVGAFALRTQDGEARPPHRSLLPESELPPGTTLSGVLVFDVPRDATVGFLSYGDGGHPTELRLPVEEGSRPGQSRSGPVTGTPEGGHPTGHADP